MYSLSKTPIRCYRRQKWIYLKSQCPLLQILSHFFFFQRHQCTTPWLTSSNSSNASNILHRYPSTSESQIAIPLLCYLSRSLTMTFSCFAFFFSGGGYPGRQNLMETAYVFIRQYLYILIDTILFYLSFLLSCLPSAASTSELRTCPYSFTRFGSIRYIHRYISKLLS
jgi:hypothetical protein